MWIPQVSALEGYAGPDSGGFGDGLGGSFGFPRRKTVPRTRAAQDWHDRLSPSYFTETIGDAREANERWELFSRLFSDLTSRELGRDRRKVGICGLDDERYGFDNWSSGQKVIGE